MNKASVLAIPMTAVILCAACTDSSRETTAQPMEPMEPAAAAAHYAPPPAPGEVFSDCDTCPEMTVVPAGSFVMGFDGAEEQRERDEHRYEGPTRKVTLAASFAVGRHEISNQQFAAFVAATGHQTSRGCYTWDGVTAEFVEQLDWRDPGYGRETRPDEAVTCVDWNDAYAYTLWLAALSGKPYRLLTEAEWEYAARGGVTTEYLWGDDASSACRFANIFDYSAQVFLPDAPIEPADCDDGHAQVAPVGSFEPNGFGLYDMTGNVWEWVFDCYVMPYPDDAPIDGSAIVTEDCPRRSVRGGSWMTSVDRQRFTFRGRDPATLNSAVFGFRIARDLTPE